MSEVKINLGELSARMAECFYNMPRPEQDMTPEEVLQLQMEVWEQVGRVAISYFDECLKHSGLKLEAGGKYVN